MSQFSRKLDQGDEDADVETEKQLDMLEMELVYGDGVGDEEPEVRDNDDEIAEDVAASDGVAVTAIVREANESIRLDALLREDVDVARVSIAKVCDS